MEFNPKKFLKIATIAALTATPLQEGCVKPSLQNNTVTNNFDIKKYVDTGYAYKNRIKEIPTPNGEELIPSEMFPKIEKDRQEWIESYKVLVATEKRKLETHDSFKLFEEDFWKDINYSKKYFDSLASQYLHLKTEVDSFSDGEIKNLIYFLSQKQKHADDLEKEYGHPNEETRASADADMELEKTIGRSTDEENSNSKFWDFYTNQVKPALLSDNKKFMGNLLAENSRKTAKEIFKSAIVQMVLEYKSDVSFSDKETLFEELQTQWKNRDSKDLIRLRVTILEKEFENIKKYMNPDSLIAFVASARTRVIETIEKQHYYEMLIKEGMTPDEAKRVQAERAQNARSASFVITSDDNSLASTTQGGKIVLDAMQIAQTVGGCVEHEVWHATTNSNQGLTRFEKKKLENSWAGNSAFDKMSQRYSGLGYGTKKKITELNGPTELYARLQILRDEMKKFGMDPTKKMSHEDYRKLLELANAGSLGRNAMDILIITSEDGFIDMFDSVASTEEPQKYKEFV